MPKHTQTTAEIKNSAKSGIVKPSLCGEVGREGFRASLLRSLRMPESVHCRSANVTPKTRGDNSATRTPKHAQTFSATGKPEHRGPKRRIAANHAGFRGWRSARLLRRKFASPAAPRSAVLASGRVADTQIEGIFWYQVFRSPNASAGARERSDKP